MSYIIFDLETTIRNKIGNNKGSSHCKENKIVYIGWKRRTHSANANVEYWGDQLSCTIATSGWAVDDYNTDELFVGHNVKFDLLYLLRYDKFRKEVFPKLLIWDTALVEFIITGQEHKFPSLDECALKYGGTVKPDKVKELWNAGVDTDKIDRDLMEEYLTGDVNNTEKVFLPQFEYCKENGLLPLVWSQMSALKATTMMEHNGMKIDVKELREYKYEKVKDLADLQVIAYRILVNHLHRHLGMLNVSAIEQIVNLDSPQFISKVLFGGTCEYTMRENIGIYKTGARAGMPKYKNVEYEVLLPTLVAPRLDWETKKVGIFKVGEEELKELLSRVPGGFSGYTELFIEAILKVRELSKEVNTYIEGISDLIYEDGCIHGNLQHTVAITGRLTSSNPNLQNITCPKE